MPHRTPRLVRRLVFGFVLATLAVTAEERRLIPEQDLFSFVWVADPQLSPDGTEIAFVRVTVDKQKDQYDSAIWAVRADGREPPRQLTFGTVTQTNRFKAAVSQRDISDWANFWYGRLHAFHAVLVPEAAVRGSR